MKLILNTRCRIVHINHNMKSGDFFTIQYYAGSDVADYSDVKHIQEELRDLFYKWPYTLGGIGDAYGKWLKRLDMFIASLALTTQGESLEGGGE